MESPQAPLSCGVCALPKANRGRLEQEELRRRQAWLEDNGYHVDLVDILDNLKQEGGNGHDPTREWRRHRRGSRR